MINNLLKVAIPLFPRRIYLLLFSLLLIFQVSFAQKQKIKKDNTTPINNDAKFEMGITSGLAINNFSENQPHTGINLGYTGGLSFNYYFYKGISLQLETNYVQKGGQLLRFKDDTRYGMPETFDSKNVKNSSYILHSADIPLLLNYTFKIKQTWKPSVYVGGGLTYISGVTERYQKTGNLLPGEDIIATTSGFQNVTGGFEKHHWNGVVGSNIKVPFVKSSFLQLDFRYVKGLTAAKKQFSYMEKEGFGEDLFTNAFISKIGIIFPVK